jgi:hypothetical protein
VSVTGRVTEVFGRFVASYLFYSAARLTAASVLTEKRIERSAESAPVADTAATQVPRVVLLLPMLREDRLITDACRHLLPAVRAFEWIDVIVITSEREAVDQQIAQQELRCRAGNLSRHQQHRYAGWAVTADAVPALEEALRDGNSVRLNHLLSAYRRPTTADVARSLLAELNLDVGRSAFRHWPVSADVGSKVGKLNHAIDQWLPTYRANGAVTYVGVYDADSLPDLAVFQQIAAEVARRSAAEEPLPAILQQVSCYCRNLPSLKGTTGLLSLADAIAQTRWALGFEFPLYAKYSKAVRSGRIRPLVYCVGHGCFVSVDFLQQIGGFPRVSPTDDLALGYVASALGAEVVPIAALDYCEVAPDPVQSTRQARFWFSGSTHFWHDLRYARRAHHPAIGSVQWAALLVDGWTRNAAWAGRAVAWTAALILAVGTRRWRLASALALAHFAYVQVGYVQTVLTLHRLGGVAEVTGIRYVPRWRLAAGCLAASGSFVLRSLGPLIETMLSPRSRAGALMWKQER